MFTCFAALVGGMILQTSAVTPVAEPAVTIYNQDFAVVREIIPLELAPGVNEVSFAETTAHLEPDSVILRDPAGQRQIRVHEQNYRGDPISQALLLSLYEGKTINFLVVHDGVEKRVPGRIVRSGYVPHYSARDRYSQQYWQQQQRMAYSGGASEPLIECEGELRFGLPGVPLFPELTDDSILKPTLHWRLETDQPGTFNAELAYVTGGMSWEADYNIMAPESGDRVDIIGWVTMDNQSGRTFENTQIKLIAGDVNKVQEGQGAEFLRARASAALAQEPAVTEKSFDEYHMYTLHAPTTLRDRETKQVEFVRATDVQADRLYVYDGVDVQAYGGWGYDAIRNNADYGTKCNRKVWVMVEFANSEANNLGMPLPKGRLRFYRQDDDGRLEFTGEDIIDHTPAGETVRVYTGNAFDVVGERVRTNFNVDGSRREIDESFEITLRNHKDEPVEVRVVEHLYRWTNWEIKEATAEYRKTDSQTIEFPIAVAADEEKTVAYTVHYTW